MLRTSNDLIFFPKCQWCISLFYSLKSLDFSQFIMKATEVKEKISTKISQWCFWGLPSSVQCSVDYKVHFLLFSIINWSLLQIYTNFLWQDLDLHLFLRCKHRTKTPFALVEPSLSFKFFFKENFHILNTKL